ncbi:MAG: thiol oxidoreductase [Planctomycetota bacterium]|nr:thiol oxidoreductase [Planctomycetota bacterium]MDA1249894.1 thiol oxidoreductase [Planctomycetota bacterium]
MFRLAALASLALIPAVYRLTTLPEPNTVETPPAMVDAGKILFDHEWQPDDPLTGGDGLGPVFNAKSCVACHRQGAPGGGGPNEHNVIAFTVQDEKSGLVKRSGVVHLSSVAPEFREQLTHVHPNLPNQLPVNDTTVRLDTSSMPDCFAPRFSFPRGVTLSQRNTPAIFGAKLIEEISDNVIEAEARRQRLKWAFVSDESEDAPVGRVSYLAGGKVGHFGWKGQTARLGDFVQGACANELGLSNPAADQPVSLAKGDYKGSGTDLTQVQCDQITAFCASLARPVEIVPDNPVTATLANKGREVFSSVGCVNCHPANLGSVEGLYSDLLMHRMGQELVGGGSYNDPPVPVPDAPDGPHPSEWRTPPLWGVADSAPYLHDGRAASLRDAIVQHSGQGRASSIAFQKLSVTDQTRLIAFLETLRAPGAKDRDAAKTTELAAANGDDS